MSDADAGMFLSCCIDFLAIIVEYCLCVSIFVWFLVQYSLFLRVVVWLWVIVLGMSLVIIHEGY